MAAVERRKFTLAKVSGPPPARVCRGREANTQHGLQWDFQARPRSPLSL